MAWAVKAVVIAALVVSVGPIASAQDNEDWNSRGVEGVYNVIPVQGRLATSGGSPLDGWYTVTFRFYDASSGGTLLCEDDDSILIDNGLFRAAVDWCTADDISGRSLYMSVEVGTDGEMAPRLAVYPVPYAFSLMPGSRIVDDLGGGAVLHVENSGASGRAIRAYAMDDSSVNYGVVGASVSPSGFGGYFYNNGGGVGLRAEATDASGGDAIQAESASEDALQGVSTGSSGRGVYASNTGGGMAIAALANSTGNLYPTAYLVQENSGGNFLVGASSYWGTRYFRIDRTGKGFFNGGTQTGGADFAERIDVVGGEELYEPGDVLVIAPEEDRTVALSKSAFATSVMGVYSTEPGVLAGSPDGVGDLGGVPVAITGIVPCKVSGENGAIRRGDLLVTSSVAGHAMRAGDDPPAGTVLGKALQPFDADHGVIEIFVAAQ